MKKIDKKVTFKSHISDFIIYLELRIRKFLIFEIMQNHLQMSINSQFNYVPLIRMFPNKILIDKILKMHYRTL